MERLMSDGYPFIFQRIDKSESDPSFPSLSSFRAFNGF